MQCMETIAWWALTLCRGVQPQGPKSNLAGLSVFSKGTLCSVPWTRTCGMPPALSVRVTHGEAQGQCCMWASPLQLYLY